jgi:transposase
MARRQRLSKRTAQPGVMHPDAAGIDVGATAVYVAVRPDADAQPIQRFATFTRDLHALAKWLKRCQVRTVAMESTGVYWIPLFQILEAYRLEVVLVNAHHVHSVPGRKSDVADCEWLRYLHSVGLLHASFRPPDSICVLRALLRHRDGLVKTASRSVLHMQKAFDQMNIHIHHALSDLTGLSGLRIVDAILEGQRDPERLADLVDPHVRASRDTLVAALEGDWRAEHLFALRQARQTYAHYQGQIAACDREIETCARQLQSPQEPPVEATPPASGEAGPHGPGEARRTPEVGGPAALLAHYARLLGVDLTRIPSIGLNVVQAVCSEVGPDLSRFRTPAHFASWLNICPHNKCSGDKILSAHTGPGANRLAQALRWATQSLYRSPSYLGQYFRRLRTRLGTPKAVVAVAHKLARIIYHLITHQVEYDDSLFAQQEAQHRERTERRLRVQARALGLQLVPAAG